ncbi:hypothetical protein DQ04_02991010 [Trypanosoma grayi]|uniref:hypothetical protein n=1 Tax=Trypanosoma grayi TaxID=71804 RepID=UPI0004F3F77B|nr:hypothetical protein DQ04_02991010 [Trypanosoma grayi]KEG11085.1 hypothetical protein DQ04_02991010 [Trypanosoma grayi]
MAGRKQRKRKLLAGASIRTTLNLETVLPVLYVDDMEEVRAKYKPFGVIEDYHSDDNDADGESADAKLHAALQRTRKRGRVSSAVTTIDPVVSGDLPTPRVGWAKTALREDTPYSLLQRRDLFERCFYVMDHDDYVWCHENAVPSAFFVEVVTHLERAYAKQLITFASDIQATAGAVNSTTKNKNDNDQVQEGHVAEICGVCARPELAGEEEHFLHCRRCGCLAHVRCWFLDRLPPHADDWRCPSCAVARRERGVGHCHLCGRRGGVMLPYISSSDWKQQKVEVSSLFCHIVCCLAFEELALDVKHRVVHPARRAKKAGQLGHCAFCHGHCSGARGRCHHPRCFEVMHPVCAQQAGTIECYRSPQDTVGSGPWEGCRLYCRAHFRGVVGSESESARVGESAEAQALCDVTLALLDSSTEPSRKVRRSATRRAVTQLDAVKEYWKMKRAQRHREGTQAVEDIQKGRCDFLAVLFRPEVMKITPTEVCLSRFVCLIPELQHHVNAMVEGLLPIPDDEYDDVQEYRKIQSRTRHGGDTVKLYEKMQVVESSIKVFCELADLLHQRAVVRREWVETELQFLDAKCQWGSFAR